MIELVYGTKNPAKLGHMRNLIGDLPIALISLADLDLDLPEPDESGADPLENARIKALAYYQALGRSVFSCDSGLFLQGVPEDLQPGVHVRRVKGKYLSDDEMIAYYSALAKRYGTNGKLIAQWRNAICLVMGAQERSSNLSCELLHESMDESLASESFYICAQPHARRVSGFPMDCISMEIASGQCYYDLPGGGAQKYVGGAHAGFRAFFERAGFG